MAQQWPGWWRAALAAALFLGLWLAAGKSFAVPAPDSGLIPEENPPPPLAIDSEAPDFDLPLAAGCRWSGNGSGETGKPGGSVRLKLSALRKSHHGVVVLVFWAFWCDTWKDAAHRFQQMKEQLRSQDVQVACVTVDSSQQPVARAAFGSGEIWYPVAIDASSQVTHRYGVRRVPTLLVLDSEGLIVARFEAFPAQAALFRAIKQARGRNSGFGVRGTSRPLRSRSPDAPEGLG